MASQVHNEQHDRTYDPQCADCQAEDTAVDWLMAVRKYGIETANRMFEEK